MQSFFLENPLWLTVCGLFLALVSGYLWTQTGARAAWITALVAVAVTVLLVFVSVQVVTDREKIYRTINAVAEAMESNDLKQVTTYIHPHATQELTTAQKELSRFTFRVARMTRLKSIAVNHHSKPATAVAEFNVIVEVMNEGHHARIPRFIKAYFAEEGGRWLVRDYEHFDLATGFRE